MNGLPHEFPKAKDGKNDVDLSNEYTHDSDHAHFNVKIC